MRGTELQPKRCAGGYVFCIPINNLYLYSLVLKEDYYV